MSIFGNQTTNATAPQGGLFGAQNNQQQSQQQPTGGIFGSLTTPQNQQANQPSTSIFGNPAPNTNTGGTGLFGGQSATSNTTSNTNQGMGGGSLFGGGQQQQQPAAGSSLFGANTQQSQAVGGGLFGASNQQQQQPATGGGLFGGGTQQQQQPAATGIFGSNTNTQQPQQQQSGSIFGGNTQQGGGSTFGNKPGGLFGGLNINTNTTNTTPSPNTTTNTNPLFGGSLGQPQQQQQQQQTGGLFGQSTQNQQPQGGGLSGQSAQNQQPQGGGLFGQSAQNQQPQGGGLFGQSAQNQQLQGGGLFGQSAQNQQPQGGGLFGQSSQTQQPQGGGLFGQTAQNQQPQTGGLFGQSTQNQQQRPSLFGNLGQSTTSPNPLFGGGNTNTLNTTGSAQQQGDAQAQSAKLIQRIEAIYAAWSPDSPQCRFQHTFYNLVNPNQVSLYRQPPNIPNDIWEKATRDNPDPTCFVPVMAFGFDNLRERVEAQSKQAEEHKARLKDLKASLEALAQRHAVSNAPRLQRAGAQQTQLTQRLLAFIQHLHLLIPAIRSSSIRPEEEQLRGKLEEIEEDVRRGRIKGKLNELWALIGAVKAAQERGRVGGGGGGGEWAVVDDEGLAQISQIGLTSMPYQILSEQQAGLAHLTKILQKALKDLSVIMGNGASGSRGEDSYANDGDSLWSSTNTLRASSFR
ncbi:nucleoporin complex subunit 54-domain-containing protein [Collybia nuda]|uniref:Nucleoporin complex subunit 54-domain-containing protein n=1 Tax=Collybia nuda TaxID=64659 RepID=A0A9P5XZ19_9AGAR|nr:nucleoporin complex subunit 54-domain-containing protein [Collybia nuda]